LIFKAVVEDEKKITVTIGGDIMKVGALMHSLRKNLYSEHSGLSIEEVADPLDENLIAKMDERAKVICRKC